MNNRKHMNAVLNSSEEKYTDEGQVALLEWHFDTTALQVIP